MESAIERPISGALELAHNDVLQQNWTSGGDLRSADLERLLVASLPLVDRLSRYFCRGSRMTAEDVDDFVAHVRVHLLENDYAALRAFEGRCKLPTYLALAIQHLLFDYRSRIWGRFRTSAAATRLGPAAVRLEVLLLRDGKSLVEATTVLTTEGYTISGEEAERLARQLPERKPRAVEIDIDEAEASELAVSSDSIEIEALSRDRRATSRAVADAMLTAMGNLPAEDRTILRLHFDAGMSVADIARSMGLDQRRLYRRIRRICDTLRERLLAANVRADDVADLLGRADSDLDFGLREVRNPAAASSTEVEERVKR